MNPNFFLVCRKSCVINPFAITANVVVEHVSSFGLFQLTEQAQSQSVQAVIVMLSRQFLVLHSVKYLG